MSKGRLTAKHLFKVKGGDPLRLRGRESVEEKLAEQICFARAITNANSLLDADDELKVKRLILNKALWITLGWNRTSFYRNMRLKFNETIDSEEVDLHEKQKSARKREVQVRAAYKIIEKAESENKLELIYDKMEDLYGDKLEKILKSLK